MLVIFAALKQYQERTIQTVRLFPNEAQSLYGRAVQSDGSVATQIAIRMEVFNISEKLIWLPDLKLLRPTSHARVLHKMLTLREKSSHYHGPYELPPGERTNGSAHFIIAGDLTDQIARHGVRLCIEDQFGHRHKLKLTNLRKS